MNPLAMTVRGQDTAAEKPRACLVSQDEQLAHDFVVASGKTLYVEVKHTIADLLSEDALTSHFYVVDTLVRDMDLWPTSFQKFREALSVSWFLLAPRIPDPSCESLLPFQLRFLDRNQVSGAQIAAAVKREIETEREHHIAAMRYVEVAEGFAIRLGTGRSYFLPLADLSEADGTSVVSAEMGEDDSYFIVKQESGNWFEIPWDDVLYHCEPAYPYYRKTTEWHEQGDLKIGMRLRELRKRKGLTITELARRGEMKRPNLSRIEHGKHRPSLETLERLSEALGVPVAELVRNR